MTNNFKCSIFFLLFFCVMPYSSAIFATKFIHGLHSPPPEFTSAIETFLEKRDAGPIAEISADNQLLIPASEGCLYKVNNGDAIKAMNRYCPDGYFFSQSNGTREGIIFSNHEEKYPFKLKKYNSIVEKNLPAEPRIFSGKMWQIILFYPNGTMESYVLIDFMKFHRAEHLEPRE